MKRIIVAIMMGAVLTTAAPSMAQHHRHTPTTNMSASTMHKSKGADTTAIVAFSDTTESKADEDTLDDDETYGWDKPYDMGKIGDVIENAFMPLAIVFIMFFLAPVMIIALLVYFMLKSRKQKIQLAELALKNGQPIPEEVIRKDSSSCVPLWDKGIKKLFLGIGIVVLAVFIDSSTLEGIGFLVAFYGIGQAVIAWTNKKKIAPNSGDRYFTDSDKEGNDVVNNKETRNEGESDNSL